MKTEINGIKLEAEGLFYIANRGMVMTFKVEELPNNKSCMDKETLYPMLMGQTLLGCLITGIEAFAIYTVNVGHCVGLLLTPIRG